MYKRLVHSFVLASTLLLSLHTAFADSDFKTACPNANTFKHFDGDYTETSATSYDVQTHTARMSVTQKKRISDSEDLVFVISGITVADGEDEELNGEALIGELKSDNNTPILLLTSASSTDSKDNIVVPVCAYSLPNNDQVKGLAFIVKVEDEDEGKK